MKKRTKGMAGRHARSKQVTVIDLPQSEKKWRIELNTSNIHKSKITYGGEQVGMVRTVEFGADVDMPFPFITFSVWIRNVEVVTKDDPPPGI